MKEKPVFKNTTDIGIDGVRRWVMMCNYTVDWERAVQLILKAWGVVEHWAIDNNAINSASSRHFMCKFDDGKWYACSFGGINGPPCASCNHERPFEGETGEIAYRRERLDIAQRAMEHAIQLADERTKEREKASRELFDTIEQYQKEKRNAKKEAARKPG